MTNGDLKRTALFQVHAQLGAKLVPFAGYEMPVQYPTGILEEHRAVRTAAGLFDVSHMGEVYVHGPQALDFVQYVTTNDAAKLTTGQAQYSALCAEDGGVLDDCIVYRFSDRMMIVVNAARRADDVAWFNRHGNSFDVTIEDRSDETALIALQGPASQSILGPLTGADLDAIAYYHFGEDRVAGVDCVISRTGYTGEDGFELYFDANHAVAVWTALLDAGKKRGLIPAGLGARDSLRLEVGYALYGSDVDESRTPIEAGLGWIVKLDKGDFIGREAIRKRKEEGPRERLVGFELTDRGFPRRGYEVRADGARVGEVTSGTHSPMLGTGIGLAYVRAAVAKQGTELEIMLRGKGAAATVVRPPFYKQGSIRRS